MTERARQKRNLFLALGVAVLVFSFGSYWLLKGPTPFESLRAYSELELPAGTKAILWRSDGKGQSGLFELPKASIAAFAARNNLKPDAVLTYELSSQTTRCAKEGRAEYLSLNEETGALEVQIDDEPCTGEGPAI